MVHGDGRQLACEGGEGGRTQRFLSRQSHDLAPVPLVRDDTYSRNNRDFMSAEQLLSTTFPL
jgi:hypothetical protein